MTENNQTPERVTVRIILKCGQTIQFECEDFTVYTDKESGAFMDYSYQKATGDFPIVPPVAADIAAIVKVSGEA